MHAPFCRLSFAFACVVPQMALMPRVGEAFLTFNPEASLEQQIASTFEDVEHVILALPRADRLAYKAMVSTWGRGKNSGVSDAAHVCVVV